MTTRHDFITLPEAHSYTLGNARVPLCCIEQPRVVDNATDSSDGGCGKGWQTCVDGLTAVDIQVSGGSIVDIRPASTSATDDAACLDVRESMLLPAFVDLHTHIGQFTASVGCDYFDMLPHGRPLSTGTCHTVPFSKAAHEPSGQCSCNSGR